MHIFCSPRLHVPRHGGVLDELQLQRDATASKEGPQAARSAAGNRQAISGRLKARLHYVRAVAQFQLQDMRQGERELADVHQRPDVVAALQLVLQSENVRGEGEGPCALTANRSSVAVPTGFPSNAIASAVSWSLLRCLSPGSPL